MHCPCSLQVVLEVGPLRLPLPIKPDGKGFVEWLYLDEDFRITRVGVALREWCCILEAAQCIVHCGVRGARTWH